MLLKLDLPSECWFYNGFLHEFDDLMTFGQRLVAVLHKPIRYSLDSFPGSSKKRKIDMSGFASRR